MAPPNVSFLVKRHVRRKFVVRQRDDDVAARARGGRQLPRQIRLLGVLRVALVRHPLLQQTRRLSLAQRGQTAGFDTVSGVSATSALD